MFLSYGNSLKCYNVSLGACCHISTFLSGYIKKKVYTVLIKQNHIIVLDMWGINVGKNKYSHFTCAFAQTEKVKMHYVVWYFFELP